MPMASPSPNAFRPLVWVFAGVLVLQASWLVAVELLRPRIPYFPTDQATAQRAKINRLMTAIAARVGLVRGELWSDAALASSAEVVGNILHFNGAPAESDIADSEQAARRAVRLAPHDARAWLILA